MNIALKIHAMKKETPRRAGALMLGLFILGGCGYMPDPAADAKRASDEAAAVGSACRQAGRSVEQCFERQGKVEKSGALRGWRDMDEYMRQNKLDPQSAPPKEEKPKADAAKEGKGDSADEAKESH